MEIIVVPLTFLFILLLIAIVVLGPIILLITGVVLVARAVSNPPLATKTEAPPPQDKSQERRRILDMLASGQIGVPEAERLLSALGHEQPLANSPFQTHTKWLNWPLVVGIILILLVTGYFLPNFFAWIQGFSTAIFHPGTIAFGTFPNLISVAIFIFWLWMLIDCIRRPIPSFALATSLTQNAQYDKIIWLVAMFIVNVIASIAYFFVIYRPLKQK